MAKRLGRADMQSLPAAFEQAVIGGVLDQRVLETIEAGRRRDAFDEEQVGVDQLIQCGLEGEFPQKFREQPSAAKAETCVRAPRQSAQPRAPLAAAGRAGRQAIAGGRAGSFVPSSTSRVNSSMNSGTPAVRSVRPSIDLARERMPLGDGADHLARSATRSSGASAMTPAARARVAQGVRNSGRVVATMKQRRLPRRARPASSSRRGSSGPPSAGPRKRARAAARARRP